MGDDLGIGKRKKKGKKKPLAETSKNKKKPLALMARAAALARLEQGPLPLSSLLKELSSFDKNEVLLTR